MKISLAIAALVAAAGSASADVVAYWNFNNSTANTTAGQLGVLNSFAADQGSGTVSVGNGITFNTVAAGTANGAAGTFSGNVLNALGADGSGGALSVQGAVGGSGTAPVTSNGATVDFTINMSIFTNLVMTFAGRGTSTGFGSSTDPNQVLISTDGVNFSQVATYESRQTTFALYTFNIGNALDGASTAIVRLRLNGASSGAGNNRIDNVQLNATLVPTPGSLALVGLGGLVATRRRR
ncbi:MAG: PEP-CTERM sorting domain-containing protein [Planctomycetes bacterium]|nr:PEP-CTERM sorting domain-containing protein [Planctomycetota bacterium]